MTDDLAIRLFVRDGGVAGEWHAQDPCTMNHYRKEAAKLQTRPSQRSDDMACIVNSKSST